MDKGQSSRNDLVNLDFLRASAISLVVFAHILYFFNLHSVFKIELGFLGRLGVVLFFVHTSLVLMMSLQRQVAQYGMSSFFKFFYLRRAFRIYPLSIFAVTTIWLLNLPLHTGIRPLVHADLDQLELFANLALVQNFFKKSEILGVLWSLPFEVQMYIVFPFFFMFVSKIKNPSALTILWAIFAFVGSSLGPKIQNLNESLTYFQIPNFILWIPCFFSGIIAYRLRQETKNITLPFFAVPLSIIFVSAFSVISPRFEKDFFASLLVGFVISYAKDMRSVWLTHASKAIAKYSYGIYLFHYFSLYYAFEKLKDQNPFLQWTVFIVTMFSLPYLFFHAIENPFIKLGQTLVEKLARKSSNENKLHAA